MTAAALIPVGMAVMVGAATQRITGLGFGLVSAPFLVLALGPFNGVLLANLLAFATSLAVLVSTWRYVELRRTLLLVVPALVAVLPGAWVARHTSPPLLAVIVGTAVIVALLLLILVERLRVFRGTPGAIAAGALSGFMGVTAGVGGPAVTLYALSTGWKGRGLVASLQLLFASTSAAALAAKGLPPVPVQVVATALVALLPGLLIGQWIATRVNAHHAHIAVITLALLGALATVAKGLTAL